MSQGDVSHSTSSEVYDLILLTQSAIKWKAKGYATSHTDLVAYIFAHEYSSAELLHGVASLKGSDAHILVHLRGVAEELGFEVFLGNLEYHLQGAANDDGHSYHKRGRYGGWGYDDSEDEESDEGTPGMLEVYERNLSVSHLVSLEGPIQFG